MQVCLTGNIQEDNCAVDSQTCWSSDTMHLDACVDTYRGYVCKCPDGESRHTEGLLLQDLSHSCAL